MGSMWQAKINVVASFRFEKLSVSRRDSKIFKFKHQLGFKVFGYARNHGKKFPNRFRPPLVAVVNSAAFSKQLCSFLPK